MHPVRLCTSMEKVVTRGSSFLGVYEVIQGWDWDGIVLLNSLTFMPANLSCSNYPSYLCNAGLEWLLYLRSERDPQCQSPGFVFTVEKSVRKLNNCVGTVVHHFRSIFACLTCLFVETAFCFLFLC